MRLLQAINKDELKVPSEIAKMEAEMKKEYAGAIRKAKLAVKAQQPDKESAAPARGKKRKAEEQLEPENTKITVKADGMTIHIERSASTPVQAEKSKTPAKIKEAKDKLVAKAKPAPKERPAPKAKSATQDKSAPKEKPAPKEKAPTTAKQTASDKATSKTAAEARTVTKASTTPSTKNEGPIAAEKPTKAKTSTATATAPPSTAKKQTARRGGITHQMPSTRPAIVTTDAIEPVRAPRTKQTARRGGPLASTARAARTTVASSASDTDTVLLTGVWDATCPELENLYPQCAGKLRLFLCVGNEKDRLWGGFKLAYKEGVFLLDDLARAVAGKGTYASYELKYRSRDLEDGSRAFHGGCVGLFRIFADGTILVSFRGMFTELDEVVVKAKRRSGPLWCGKSETRFQEEWDAFVQETYGRPTHVKQEEDEQQYGNTTGRIRVKHEEEEEQYYSGDNDFPDSYNHNEPGPDPYREDYEYDDYYD